MINNNSNDTEVINTLRKISFFEMYADDDELIRKIAGMCTKQSVKRGKVIIREGDYGDELFIIMKGEIDIVKKTLQNEPYTVVSLDAERGGIYVGELALIDNDRRSATVVANTDCEYLVIKRENFIKFGNENLEIGLNVTRAIAGQLSTKLRKSNIDVITLFSALVEEIAETE